MIYVLQYFYQLFLHFLKVIKKFVFIMLPPLDMEISYLEGFFYIMVLWGVSKVYDYACKYFKSAKKSVPNDLYSAVCNGHLHKLRHILFKDVDVNTRIGRDQNTLLHFAPSAEITRELLMHGAEVDAANDDGMSPLFFAIIDNKGLAVVKELLDHGADINLKSNDGHTTLHFVPCLTDKKGVEVVKELLKHGASVNVTDNDSATPLFFAVMCETNLDIVKELLLHGADINVRGRYPFTTRFFTPLDLAVDEEKVPFAKLILKIIVLKYFEQDYKKIINLESYSGSFDYRELSFYLDCCITEVNRMKNFKINNNVSLYDFVSKLSDSENLKPLYASTKITRKEIHSSFPIYFDVFWPNMKLCLERADLLNKLSELTICVESDKVQEVALNYDCMYKIGEYLSNDDMVNFISGFEKVLNSFQIFRTTLWN